MDSRTRSLLKFGLFLFAANYVMDFLAEGPSAWTWPTAGTDTNSRVDGRRRDGRPTEKDYWAIGCDRKASFATLQAMPFADLRALFRKRIVAVHPDRVVMADPAHPTTAEVDAKRRAESRTKRVVAAWHRIETDHQRRFQGARAAA